MGYLFGSEYDFTQNTLHPFFEGSRVHQPKS